MSPSDLGVFDLDKRAEAAEETSSGKATVYDTVTAGWMGKDCGTHGVRPLRLLNRATQAGKQRRTRGTVS